MDGIVCVSAGAGGHAGTINPFALVSEVRRVFDGTILLGGCINTGAQIAAARLMGADLAYLGTRFIATSESLANDAYKAMLLASGASDVIYTASISGIGGNFLAQSLINAGVDLSKARDKHRRCRRADGQRCKGVENNLDRRPRHRRHRRGAD